MSTMKPTTSADPDDMIDVDHLVANLVEIEQVVHAAIRNLADNDRIDLSEDSPLWNYVGAVAGSISAVADAAWPEGTGPIS